ncbi:MAG: urease subunit beta [Aggregatilineales bacterium]
MRPGEYFLDETANTITLNVGRKTARLLVNNVGDRPIQVGSHFHFFEVNRALIFDRAAAYGMHLNIPAGTAVRFEPGEQKEITLVDFGGSRIMRGHNGLVDGALDDPQVRENALKQLPKQTG